MDDETYQALIKTKCNLCFLKDAGQDACLLYAKRHAGIENCLGPFKDQEDRMQKLKEDFYREEKHADLDRVARDIALNAFKRKKKLFDE